MRHNPPDAALEGFLGTPEVETGQPLGEGTSLCIKELMVITAREDTKAQYFLLISLDC
jgi:hypothetical protein